jgi:hypothetical protein
MPMSTKTTTIMALAALALFAVPGYAQTGARPAAAPVRPAPPPPTGPAPTGAPNQAAAPTQAANEGGNVKVERGAGGKKIYKITTEIRIEGKIQKPEAFYVLQKSAINYEWQELRQDFLPKILDSVTQAPF